MSSSIWGNMEMAGIKWWLSISSKIPIRRRSRWMDSFIHSFLQTNMSRIPPMGHAPCCLLGEWIIMHTSWPQGLTALRCFSSFPQETDNVGFYRRDFRLLRKVPGVLNTDPTLPTHPGRQKERKHQGGLGPEMPAGTTNDWLSPMTFTFWCQPGVLLDYQKGLADITKAIRQLM